jgi:hypothetical protein
MGAEKAENAAEAADVGNDEATISADDGDIQRGAPAMSLHPLIRQGAFSMLSRIAAGFGSG